MLNPYCAEETPVRNTPDCTPEYSGRIIHAALVHKSVTIPKTSAAAMITAILTAEKDCLAYVLRNVNGSYDGGSVTEGTGRGKQTTRITGGTHTDTITDFEAIVNVPFWNRFRDQAINYNYYRFTDGIAFPVEGKQIVAIPNIPIPEDNMAEIVGSAVIRWNGKDMPEPIFGSTDALETMPDLGAVTITEFGAAAATVAGTEVTQPNNTPLEIAVNFADGATSYAMATGSTLPAGLTLNDTNGQITGTAPAGANTYTFSVVGYSACGIKGLAQITLIITA